MIVVVIARGSSGTRDMQVEENDESVIIFGRKRHSSKCEKWEGNEMRELTTLSQIRK